ncbi:MAG: zf-HC2 domain-containing protein [Alphaproteobacteria bacterium]|nr:zf-HC2 domain-containing protein [Alphaproteobacteria bacterium]
MSEPFANEMLSAYLDGELSEGERAELEATLAEDAGLRAELDALADARAFLAEHGAVSAPEGFLDDVLALVEQEPQVVQLAWYRRPFGIPIEGLAVAAAALLVVWIAIPNSRETQAPGTGAGAAVVQPEMKKARDGYSSSYGGDAVSDAEEEGAEQEKAASEGTIDPVSNEWEPPQQDDAVADVQLETKAKQAGVDEDLALPLDKKPAFGLAESKERKLVENKGSPDLWKLEEERANAEAAAKQQAASKAAAEDAQGTNFSRVPYSYTLYTEDSAVLYRLAAIAAKHRGEVTDADKTALEVSELHGTEGATVLVKLPSHALQAFGKEIGALGNVYATADNTMFAGDPVEVRVRVQLAAGAPEGTSDPVNAARRAKEQMDDMSESVGNSLAR